MQGEYRRLLQNEFGQSKYRYFVAQTLNNKSTDEILSVPVIHVMIKSLLSKSNDELNQMEKRLNESMLISYRICRGFIPYFLCSIISIIFVRFIASSIEIMVFSIACIALCLGIRLTQYMINKFCYIDARLILSYKVSLDLVKKITKKST